MQSSTLAELEQQGEAARIELLKLAPRIEDAALKVRSAREAAHLRINAEQAPALAKVDELERLRREKVRQEFEQQKRQQAEKKAAREREAVPKDFKLMAQKREMKASGWGDRGDQWQAAPDGLKKLIEGYNAAPKEARPAILDRRIISDSGRREQVRELIAEQREQYRKNDRGMSRSVARKDKGRRSALDFSPAHLSSWCCPGWFNAVTEPDSMPHVGAPSLSAR